MIKIMVVEDDLNTQKLMNKVLTSHGYGVLLARDGLDALILLDKQHVDLVIVDVMMPNLDGYELTKQLRSSWANLPILMVTAKQEFNDKKEGFISGVDDYMTKPVNEEEMLLRLQALLRRAQIMSEHKLTFGNVVLNHKTLTISRGNEELLLPTKEFQLLFKLLSYPNVIFTRLQLMDEIWGMETTTDDHTLNVHIYRLRDRFRDWNEFEIVTVRGLGYKAVKKA
ncbi:DNA-binding response regulator [Paenibacillus oralis]|uniref:Heme response regulator HssR n=1 Tax=Paenibacillus oralis TaxID=2490856 RepID=A0A3P3U2U3_9BACL|nr:response regulator transcription factor [Paenibacillus oralis]RRJ63959.1 DNA-binding response regulator [Paenibacillus oralis]